MAWNNNSGGPWGGGGGNSGGGGPWGGGGNRGGGGGPFGSRRPPDMEDVIRKGQERLKNLIPGGFGSYQGHRPGCAGGRRDLAGHRLLPRAAQPAGDPARVRQALRQAGRAGPALQSAVADRQRRRGQRPGPAPHRDRRARRPGPRDALQPRPAPDLEREPDADRRREHRRHRVRRAVADQGRLQIRLRRAQSPRRTCGPAPRPPCARSSASRTCNMPRPRAAAASSRTPRTCLQKMLDEYGLGVSISQVQLLRVDPPQEVIGAFRDVQAARADKEKSINEANTYRNQVLPRAKGEAESIIQRGEAYKAQIVARAKRRRPALRPGLRRSRPRPRTSRPSVSISTRWRRCCAT